MATHQFCLGSANTLLVLCCLCRAPHISLALAGVEIISNGSGSHHQLRKLDTRLDLIRGATSKVGAASVLRSDHEQYCTGYKHAYISPGRLAPTAS